jgi:hypothetical protein
MFDDCRILDVGLGQRLVFVHDPAFDLPPSRSEVRRMLENLAEGDGLAAIVRELTGERLDGLGAPRSREEQFDRAAELLAGSGCCVLTTGRRAAFTGRAPDGGRGHGAYDHVPMLSDLAPREPVKATTEYFVEFVVTTDDGVAIANAQFEVKNTRGFAVRCKSDADGRVRTNVPLDELYAIRVLADIVLPPPPAEDEAKVTTGVVVGRLADESIDLSVNHRHTLVITRPRAKVVSIDRWVEARPVLLFGTMTQTDDGPTTVRGALRRALTEAGAGELHVVGHADTEGKAGDNEALALERARSVHLYLAGDRAGWAEHAFAHADVATLQAALAWAAASCGLACDPGPIDNDWGPATAAALDVLRDHAGIDHSQQLGPDDWAAIFDLYDEDLGRILLTGRDGVAAARRNLNLAATPLTMGERWPVDAPELSDHECPDNRRVDLVICAPGCAPKADTDELYDGTFLREQLPVPAELRVSLFVHAPAMDGLHEGRVDVSVNEWRGLLHADAHGIVVFSVLQGDRMRVGAAARADGSGAVIGYTTPQAQGGN